MKKSESRTPAQKKGDIGEDAALKRYIENGYTLVSRNYSKRCGEIDLIIKNGEYIVFFDGDDIICSTYVEDQLSNLKKSNADLSICRY